MCRRKVLAGLLLLLLSASTFADVIQGTVQSAITRLPGAFSATFPASSQVRPRDVFEIHHGDRVLGRAIVIEVNGNSAVLMPKAGFKGTMSHGDVAVFLRRAEEVPSLPARESRTIAYSAFAHNLRIRMTSPRSMDDLIFENTRVRIKFDITSDNMLYIHIRNKTDKKATICWNEILLHTTEGIECYALPTRLLNSRTLQDTSTILGGDSFTDELCAVVNLKMKPLIGLLQPGESPKHFDVHLVLHYPDQDFREDFRFDAAIVDRPSLLGFAVRYATDEEKDNLPVKYSEAGVVTEVLPNGPAWNAGFLLGDEIVAINGITVHSMEIFHTLLSKGAAGQKVRFTIVRKGQIQDIDVTMAPTR